MSRQAVSVWLLGPQGVWEEHVVFEVNVGHNLALELSQSQIERLPGAAGIVRGLEVGRQFAQAVLRVIPSDAATLLRLVDGELVPMAAHGVSDELFGQRFRLEDHPRLAAACESAGPLLSAADSPLPDPFDGLIVLASLARNQTGWEPPIQWRLLHWRLPSVDKQWRWEPPALGSEPCARRWTIIGAT